MTFRPANPTGCDELRSTFRPSRRSFLRAGMLGATGLTLSQLLRSEAQASPTNDKRHNSVIILWMRGGPMRFTNGIPSADSC